MVLYTTVNRRAAQIAAARALKAGNKDRRWWNKVYTGAQAEGRIQLAMAASVAVVFIGIPVSAQLMYSEIRKKNERESAAAREKGEMIKQMVYEKKIKRLNELRQEQGLEKIQ